MKMTGRHFLNICTMTMFVNIPSRIVEIQQYFIAILTPIFSTFLVCAKVAKAPKEAI
jgi:hypothetical protein